MEKTPRYTQRERNMVLGFAAQYKDVIENKRTDAESNRKKDEVWRCIAKEFNARVYHQRTAKQLRQLYKNMKLLLKKDLCGDGQTRDFMDILTALSQQGSGNSFSAASNYTRQSYKPEYEEDQRGGNSFNSSHDNDVVVIKTEDMSDNEQSSSCKNGMDDDDDDGLSNKDIPEVCLEEDDEELFTDNMFNRHNSGGLVAHNSKSSENPKCDSLLSLAIEERKRKIELLNAQIEYWKALTKKLETSTSNSPSCHCHVPRMNGLNQS